MKKDKRVEVEVAKRESQKEGENLVQAGGSERDSQNKNTVRDSSRDNNNTNNNNNNNGSSQQKGSLNQEHPTVGAGTGTGLLALHDGARIVFESQKRSKSKKRLQSTDNSISTDVDGIQQRAPLMPSRKETIHFENLRRTSDPLVRKREELMQKLAAEQYPLWAWELCCGVNVLLLGSGGHRELLEDFCAQYLQGEVRAWTARKILSCVCECALSNITTHQHTV